MLEGGAGNDTLIGGIGADTMVGGTDNDTYYVDNAGDVVTESVNGGADIVFASVSYALAANVENLTLSGSANINGTGNTLSNTLTGNFSNNILDGGAGADTMIGGAGDDTFVVDNAGDVVTEGFNGGIDTVNASITFSLAALVNVEHLTLTGSANVNGSGNALSNTLTGIPATMPSTASLVTTRWPAALVMTRTMSIVVLTAWSKTPTGAPTLSLPARALRSSLMSRTSR